MQQWPLERKIQVTQAKIMEWYCCYGGNVAVSLSGGKDSTVLLDLARRISPDIRAAFVDTGLEYPEIRTFVKSIPNVTWLRPKIPFPEVIKQYGYPVISKEVAKRIYYARKGSTWAVMHLNGRNKDGTPSKFNERYMKWRGLMDAPFLISEYCCMVMKKRPLHRFTKATGAMPVRAPDGAAHTCKRAVMPLRKRSRLPSPCPSGWNRMYSGIYSLPVSHMRPSMVKSSRGAASLLPPGPNVPAVCFVCSASIWKRNRTVSSVWS